MAKIIVAIVFGVVLVIVAAAVLAYSGVYNIAATAAHWPLAERAIEQARVRSIKAHAAGIKAPPGLDDPAKIAMGAGHFAQQCALCHGAPGVRRGEIAWGLYPPPPNLANAAKSFTPAELFWIVKNGIKMTGMPAWADHSDDEIWATVAFLEKLPGMKQQDFARLVAQTQQTGRPEQASGGSTQQGTQNEPAAGRQEPAHQPVEPRSRLHHRR